MNAKTAPELPNATPVQELQSKPLKITSAFEDTSVAMPDDVEEADDELNEHLREPGDPDHVLEQDVEPVPMAVPTASRMRKRHPFIRAFVILLVIAAATAGAYYYGNHAAEPATKPKSKQAAPSSTQKSTIAVSTKQYSSTPFSLSFSYPATWNVAETTESIAIASPAISLTTSTGTVTAHVVITVQNQQTTILNFPPNGAVAALESTKLTYVQPSTIQRAQTYLSPLGYSNGNFIDGMFITGDNGYQLGQQVPMSDLVKANPLISVHFKTCIEADCNGKTPQSVSLKSSSWDQLSAKADVTKILQSITLN